MNRNNIPTTTVRQTTHSLCKNPTRTVWLLLFFVWCSIVPLFLCLIGYNLSLWFVQYDASWLVMLYCFVLCCAVLCCAVLCCVMLCCALLCYALLWYAVLCFCAVLCCAVLFYIALDCIVLYCVVLCSVGRAMFGVMFCFCFLFFLFTVVLVRFADCAVSPRFIPWCNKVLCCVVLCCVVLCCVCYCAIAIWKSVNS